MIRFALLASVALSFAGLLACASLPLGGEGGATRPAGIEETVVAGFDLTIVTSYDDADRLAGYRVPRPLPEFRLSTGRIGLRQRATGGFRTSAQYAVDGLEPISIGLATSRSPDEVEAAFNSPDAIVQLGEQTVRINERSTGITMMMTCGEDDDLHHQRLEGSTARNCRLVCTGNRIDTGSRTA